MDLDLSESELAFQAEAREWLAANVPAEPLPSMDTEEGWALHQEWEAKLTEARWSVVSWPREYHGREASLVEWVIFEEEYYRAGAPGRVSQNGIFLLAPIIFDHGTKEQQDRFLPTMASGERIWAQCWSEPEAGLRPRLAQVDRPPRRRARRLGAQRPEDLVLAGDVRALGFRAVPLRPRGPATPWAHLLPLPAGRRGRDGAADRPARRRGRLRRGVLRGRLRPGRRRARRRRRRLVGRDEHRRQRARPVAALPRPVLRGRRPAGRPLRGAPGPAPRRRRRRRVDQGAGLPALHLGHGHPARRAAATWARRARSTRSSGPSSTSRCTRPRWTCSAPRPRSSRAGSTATRSRSPARSTPAPTRSSATSSPSASSASRGRSRRMRFELTERPARLRGLPRVGCSPPPTPPPWRGPGRTATTSPGLELWQRLAEQGVTDAGRPRPPRSRSASRSRRWAGTPCPARGSSPRRTCRSPWVARSRAIATVAVPPHVPYALDADVADEVYVGDHAGQRRSVGDARSSVDRTRRLFRGRRACEPSTPGRALRRWPCSPTSAQLLGAGRAGARRLASPT